MAVKLLDSRIQSMFTASVQIHSYKRAVEELVYNALDARSKSIAIRINIEENSIQVIDNGTGIRQTDMKVIGQKYMTSKTHSNESLDSAPNYYGYKGQSLASVIEVAKSVKITSRADGACDTFEKVFYKGRVVDIKKTETRPSKGTTVEIKGFLHNLKIQKSTIDPLCEMQDIRQFLEKLSLVHHNISMSLRDDSKNDIIFKIHKSRDIYQTIQTLFGIERKQYQELIVEKKNYKLQAYVGKEINADNEAHWIYLNGRHIASSKLHEIVDRSLEKALCLGTGDVKGKHARQELNMKQIPFYLIFITCPYNDFDINFTKAQVALEFKDWQQIKALIDKFVKFYFGDVSLKVRNDKHNNEKGVDTKTEVKKIVAKFLATNSKKLGVSQMRNGRKGKVMKRDLEISSNKKIKAAVEHMIQEKILHSGSKDELHPKPEEDIRENDFSGKDKNDIGENLSNDIRDKELGINIITKKSMNTSVNNKRKILRKNNDAKAVMKANKNTNILLKAFKNGGSKVLKKCNLISEEAQKFIKPKTSQQKVIYSQAFQYTQIKGTHSVSIRQTMRKVYHRQKNHNVNTKSEHYKHNQRCKEQIHKLQRQEKASIMAQNKNNMKIINTVTPVLTYQSHKYDVDNYVSHDYTRNKQINRGDNNKIRNQFVKKNFNEIFNQSKFVQKTHFRIGNEFPHFPHMRKSNIKKNFLNIMQETSYTIEFTNTNEEKCMDNSIVTTHDLENRNPKNNFNEKATINNVVRTKYSNEFGNEDKIKNNTHLGELNYRINLTYDVTQTIVNMENVISHQPYINNENSGDILNETNKKTNVVFISKSQDTNEFDPINYCETLLGDSQNTDNMRMEFVQTEDITELHSNLITPNKVLYDPQTVIRMLSEGEVANTNSKISQDPLEVTSRHFTMQSADDRAYPHFNIDDSLNNRLNQSNRSYNIIARTGGEFIQIHKRTGMTFDNKSIEEFENNFNIKNRPIFLPKGLSPIYKNCNTKQPCEILNDEEYFNDTMYDNFIKNIEANANLFEADIQNVNELATKNIEKVNVRIQKDSASLCFDGSSLNDAKVLGQVDNKFIAARLKSKSSGALEHLVLFDQHAVHERIRLEKNLADYINGKQWISVELDEIAIKLNRDEILFLNNFAEKFSLLGLKWTKICDREVSVNSIPRAILGRNPRQVDVIMKAVKNLIVEEIQSLKLQKGSLMFYPKAIMDLVCSEACRYAIKFGDKLSITECVKLLDDLSKCKAPFQCAHGRPVMAVLMDIKPLVVSYKVNIEKLKKRFKK